MRNLLRFISLALLCLILQPLAAGAAAGLELYGTFHAMGVIVTIAPTDDPDGNATATVEYRTGSNLYRAGFPLSRVSGARFVGSLFWLDPATTYDVRVTFSDPDGDPLNGVITTAAGATRADVTIPPPIQSYYVAPNGSGTACTLASPCSLAYGLSRVEAGQEVVLRGGVYYQGDLSLFLSGAPGAPIVIRGYPGETAILDGADPATFTWTAQGGGVYTTTINVPDPYLVVADGQRLFPYANLPDLQNLIWGPSTGSGQGLPGFYADGTTLYVRLANDADPNTATMAVSRYDNGFYVDDNYIAFVDLTFRHYGRDQYAKALFFNNASDNLVQGSTFALNNQDINIKHDSHRNLIQDNEFYDTIFGWSWDAVKQGAQFLESGGVYVNTPVTGRGNVIRRNTFHDVFDGFHVCPIGTAGVTNETDVYENLVYRAGDDGMETDGVCSNVRIWSNTFHDVVTGISVSPTYTGPVYAIRNVIYNTGAGNNQHTGTAFKFMYPTSSDGAVYLFHNTTDALLPGHSGLIVGGEAGTWETIVARNNIWAGAHYALARFTAAQLVDLDYDDLYTTSTSVFVKWVSLPEDLYLNTLAEVQTQTGQEINGLNVVPGFVDEANGDFHLDTSSQLVDAGLVIPGINDQGAYAYQGTAPDIGAYESAQNYFVCDCATDADPDCAPGDDANDGATTGTAWRTYEKARSEFGNLSADSSIRFCRGGAFDLTSAGDRWVNYNCTAANPCTVSDYTPSWGSGDEGRPLLGKTAGHAFRLGEYGDAVHDEGYVFENLDLRCTACEADNGYGFFLHSDVDDVTIDNVRIDGFDIGVYLGGSNPCSSDPDCDAHNDRLTLQNCTILNSLSHGFLGGGDDLVIRDCYFENNGTTSIYDHNIYLSDADIYPGGVSGATGIRIIGNELYRSAIDGDGDCAATSLVAHGNLTDLLIEDNVVREGVGRAKNVCWGISVDAGYATPERFEDVRIRGNKVINVGSVAIGISACVGCLIENNVVIHEQAFGVTAIAVPDTGQGSGDAQTTGAIVRNNSIYVTSPDWGIGIRVDSEGAGHTIVSNAMEYGGTSDWWSCLEADLPASSYDAIDYNVCGFAAGIWANWVGGLADWQALGWGAHSQAANPGFTSAWDLSPASNTATIVDAGHPTLSSPTDIYGYPRDSAPDAGAYEWGAGAACYDVTNDDQVTIADVQTVAGRWHDPSRYRFGYDVVPDGVINIRDMMQMAAHLSEQCQSASASVRRQGN